MNFIRTFTILVFCMSLSNHVAAAGATPPEVTIDGLHRVNGTKMTLVYAKNGVDLSQYNRIHLMEPYIAFKKNWLKTQNSIPNQHVRKEDMERIKTELSALFTDIFKRELQDKGGYTLTDDFAEDVLIIRPAIVDLDVIAPDVPGTRNSRSLSYSAGSMALYMELMDSVTGDMLVKSLDSKYDRNRAPSPALNKSRNEAAAREMLSEWAELLRLGLDEVRSVVSKQ